MSQHDPHKPWAELAELSADGNRHEIMAFLDELPTSDVALAVSRLTVDQQIEIVEKLDSDEAAKFVELLPESEAIDLIEHLEAPAAATILDQIASDHQVDLISELEEPAAAAILAEMEPSEAADIQTLLGYDEESAGGLMFKEYLAFPTAFTVSQVIDDLRVNADLYRSYEVQYAYVVNSSEQLAGVLRLRDLLLARPDQSIEQLMSRDPLTVTVDANLNELRDFFDRRPFFGVPVVDRNDRLVGVVRRGAVEEALADRDVDDFRKTQGIIQEELRTMPLVTRSRRRLAWLSVNIGLNVAAASVIAFYQDTLSQVIALAVFLPIISDMSGCSGNQAVAVSMRELSLGLVRPDEVFRVWIKELSVGLLNGLVLGGLIASVAWLWKDNAWLGLVVGVAMALNTMLAVSIGGTLPLIMRRLRLDPALASGPILTTVTDMCGFFLILSLASSMLPRLTG